MQRESNGNDECRAEQYSVWKCGCNASFITTRDPECKANLGIPRWEQAHDAPSPIRLNRPKNAADNNGRDNGVEDAVNRPNARNRPHVDGIEDIIFHYLGK